MNDKECYQASGIDLNNVFSYHAPKNDQAKRYEKLRAAAKEFARTILECCPATSEDTRTAIQKIREATMIANASIACNE
jgi:alkanesulfonate monooxygenase SsuD/methylene tetrahydromethanopterin reductase-like flavin-dependent oxidoreductase (luciferase family)